MAERQTLSKSLGGIGSSGYVKTNVTQCRLFCTSVSHRGSASSMYAHIIVYIHIMYDYDYEGSSFIPNTWERVVVLRRWVNVCDAHFLSQSVVGLFISNTDARARQHSVVGLYEGYGEFMEPLVMQDEQPSSASCVRARIDGNLNGGKSRLPLGRMSVTKGYSFYIWYRTMRL